MRIDVGVKRVVRGGRFNFSDDGYQINTLEQFKTWVEEFRLMHIDYALERRAVHLSDGTLQKNYVTVVDGSIKPENTVQVFGKIAYLHPQSMVNVLIEIFEDIVLRSPMVSGEYMASHMLLWNGFLVARTAAEVKRWLQASTDKIKPTDKFRIINVIAYARRQELLGVRDGSRKQRLGNSKKPGMKGVKVNKPNGAYHLTWRKYNAKYKWLFSRFRFEFLPGAHINSSLLRGKRTTFMKDNRPYLYPSIEIMFNKDGVMQ